MRWSHSRVWVPTLMLLVTFGSFCAKAQQFQLRSFGGAAIVNDNTTSTAGFDGAVLFPIGNRILVGPTAGYERIDNSILQTTGGSTPSSLVFHQIAGFKEGNFGGVIDSPLGGWRLGTRGGTTVAQAAVSETEGVCGSGFACNALVTAPRNDTVVGPFIGGYVSHSIFPHVGLFAEFDYTRLKDGNIFDVSTRTIVAGVNLFAGRRQSR